MSFLRKYLATIQAQLAGLTVSQKLLIGLLCVVMIATIFFTVTFSAKPEMVVLIPQAMSAEDINKAEMSLKGKYEYNVQGDKILVPADKAYQIRGELFAAQALPKDTTAAFTALIKDSNLLKTDGMSAREWNVALGTVLAQTLCSFPYIENATVIIGMGERPTLGRDRIPSSATVTLKTRGGDELSAQKIVAIVDMVRGAVPGIKAENIHITDGMRSYRAPTDDAPMPSDILAFKKSFEDDLSSKLFIMFGDIPNVKIAVNAVPDLSTRTQQKEIYDPKVAKADTQTTSKETSSNEGNGAGEPGVKPNVAASTADASGSKRSSTTNDTSTTTEVRFNKTQETAQLPAGTELKDLTASISIPRSYFVSIYHRRFKDKTTDPDDNNDTDFLSIKKEQIALAQARAKNAIGAKDDKQILVDWFDDTITLAHQTDVATAGIAPGSLVGMATQYGKPALLLAIAAIFLGPMLLMIRRAVPNTDGGEVDPSLFFGGGGGHKGKRKHADPEHIDAAEDVFGEAGEGEAVLTGIELDDATLQSRKMVDEVSKMIKENPENSASLVKRWMSKGK